jgi:hypothetical protein
MTSGPSLPESGLVSLDLPDDIFPWYDVGISVKYGGIAVWFRRQSPESTSTYVAIGRLKQFLTGQDSVGDIFAVRVGTCRERIAGILSDWVVGYSTDMTFGEYVDLVIGHGDGDA